MIVLFEVTEVVEFFDKGHFGRGEFAGGLELFGCGGVRYFFSEIGEQGCVSVGVGKRKLLKGVVFAEFHVLDGAELFFRLLYPFAVVEGFLSVGTEADGILVVVDFQSESAFLLECRVVVQEVDHIPDQLIYFGAFVVFGGFECVLYCGVVLAFQVEGFPSDLGGHVGVIDDGVELGDDLVDQLFGLHARPNFTHQLLLLELLVQFDLTQVVLEEDDFDFVLFHFSDAVEHFKGEDFYICLALQQEIEYGLVEGFAEEGVVADVNFAQLVHVAEVGKLTAVVYFVAGEVQFFQERELGDVLQTGEFVLAQVQALDLGAEQGRHQIDHSDVSVLQAHAFAGDWGLFCEQGGQGHLSLGPHSYRQLQSALPFQNRMSQKYYHNDYKKMMGLDETRTKSEKLLDRAVGGFRQREELVQERVLQKKVKEEHTVLSHREIREKLVKSIEGNTNAGKVLKPLNILKKCVNDQAFVSDAEINVFEQWSALSNILFQMDDKLIGNFSEMGLVFDCLVQILQQIIVCLRKLVNHGTQVKQQQKQEKQDEGYKPSSEQLEINVKMLIQRCEMHLLYCKMYTDDSFAFNKTLGGFKKRFYGYFQLKLGPSSPANDHLLIFLQRLLLKMFHLPHAKYEWVRQALTHFFKDFNIQFRHLLSEKHNATYLKLYNEFISQKSSVKAQMDPVNLLGNGGKGGKVTSLEIGTCDGLDKWTSKQ